MRSGGQGIGPQPGGHHSAVYSGLRGSGRGVSPEAGGQGRTGGTLKELVGLNTPC